MCYFITAVVPVQGINKIRPQFEAAGRTVDPLPDSPVRTFLCDEAIYFNTCAGHCDCETLLGMGKRLTSHGEDRQNKLRDKLRRKGWSESKIDRWTKDRRLASERSALPNTLECMSVEKWIALINRIIEDSGVDYIGLLLHWYSGRVANENISVRRIETVPLPFLTPEILVEMEEDVLYYFRRDD